MTNSRFITANVLTKNFFILLLSGTFKESLLLLWGQTVIAALANLIKNAVYARKGDIELMRLIGATNHFISMPSVVEGFIIGLISSAFAFLLELYAYNYIVDEVVSDYGIVTAIPMDSILVYLILGFAVFGILFSMIVSAFTARRYMKG